MAKQTSLQEKKPILAAKYDVKKVNKILQNKRVALFIVAYNAERHIYKTLKRIPTEIRDKFTSIYLIDDFSSDKTLQTAKSAAVRLHFKNFLAMRTPSNQGYGGNQKIGYRHAIEQNYDWVIMLHGDGQYAPEFLPQFISFFSDTSISAVFGSRMINRYEALRGGMPLYKWFGNHLLTLIENTIMGSHLSEFHSGYRAYKTAALKTVPFAQNSNNFHFDTEIIIQFLARGYRIKEFPIPTHYGDEVCHVNAYKYALNCIKSVLAFRLHKMNLFYQPNFDISATGELVYSFKKNPNTLHHFVTDLPWSRADIVVDIGASDGMLAKNLASKVASVTAVDIVKAKSIKGVKSFAFDLNKDFDVKLGGKTYDKVIALDIIEHLNNPEQALVKITNILKNGGTLYASTGNIAYIIMRITHLLGWFNYGKRGILDITHHRLFTVGSFKRLLKNNGFKIRRVIGFGPPIADHISSKGIFGLLDALSGLLAKLYPRLFSFNFLVIAEKKIPLEEIYTKTVGAN